MGNKRSEEFRRRRIGKGSPNWKGGRTVNGYIVIYVDGKPVKEHRHVMSQHLGRLLTLEEYVHHKNGNKTDNRLENLEVMTKTQHIRHHRIGVSHTEKTKRQMSSSQLKRRELERARA